MLDPAAIGARLQAVRKWRGWTQPEVAARAHRSVKWVHRIEDGSSITLPNVRHACQVYGIHPGLVLFDKRELLALIDAAMSGALQKVDCQPSAGHGVDR